MTCWSNCSSAGWTPGGHAGLLAQVPPYLSVDLSALRVAIVRNPQRTEVPITCEVALVVEHYAR